MSSGYPEILERMKGWVDEEYRHDFAREQIAIGLAFQLRHLRENRGWTQQQLAERTGKAQETISQLENPSYGRCTVSTLAKLASAFDVVPIVRLAPFSDLAEWVVNLTPERLAPRSFPEDFQHTVASARAIAVQADSRHIGRALQPVEDMAASVERLPEPKTEEELYAVAF